MAITQIIATLPAVLNDSETFYEDIAVRNNSLVTVSFPSVNTWATQANALAVGVNDKAAQVAAQAVDGGYSQTYINTNFVGVNNAQTIAGIKTFSSNPLSTATQSTNANALTKYSAVVKNSGDETIAGIKTFSSTISGSINGNASTVTNGVYTTGDQTIAGVKTFSSSPIVPTPTTANQAANKDYVDNSAIGVGQTWQDVRGSRVAGTTYTNTTGRTIMVAISLIDAGAGGSSFEVSGVRIEFGDFPSSGMSSALSMIVPNGATYRLNMSGASITSWAELR